MREIKFRAKRIDDGRWVYGQYFKTPLTDENSGTSSEAGWYFLSDGETRHCISSEYGVVFTIDVNTLGQYTGLEVNNQDIYEGDIYKCNTEKFYFIVKWSDELSMFLLEYQGEFKNSQSLGYRNLSYGEVIGNIHDNPDLLK